MGARGTFLLIKPYNFKLNTTKETLTLKNLIIMKNEIHPLAVIYQQAVKLEHKYVNLHTIRDKYDDEVFTIVTKIRDRIHRKRCPTLRALLRSQIHSRLKEMAYALPSEGYSMGSEITLSIGNPHGKTFITATRDTRSKYSNSCTYKPKWGGYSLVITPKEFQHMHIINKLLTYIYPKQNSEKKCCYWYQREGWKQHFKLVKKEGYVYQGKHYESNMPQQLRMVKLLNLKTAV